MMVALWVMIGGGIGALARYGVTETAAYLIGRPWVPVATLVVNVVGCFVIGVASARIGRGDVSWLIANKPLLVTGFCGGLTTFSTFGLETLELLQRRPALAGLLVLAHVLGGLFAVWLGQRLGS
jgi:CrcB protein